MAAETSKRFPRLSLAQVTPVLLLAVGATLYVNHVLQRRTYLVDWSFRRLAAMSGGIDSQLTSYRRALIEYMNDPKESLSSIQHMLPFQVVGSFVRDTSGQSAKKVVIKSLYDRGEAFFYFDVRGTGQQNSSDQSLLQGRQLVRQIVAPLLDDQSFDGLLFVDGQGRVLLQEGVPEMRLLNLAGLETTKGKVPALELSQSSRLAEMEIAGEKYILFVQPCAASPDESRTGDQAAGWFLVGMMRSKALLRQSLLIPTPWMIALGTLLILVVLAWPFVRLLSLRRGERLRAIDGLLVSLCAVVGISALTLLLFDTLVFARLSAIADWQLQAFAAKLQRKLTAEIDLSLQDLSGLYHLSRQKAAGSPAATGCLSAESPRILTFSLLNAKKEQALKWTVPDRATPPGRIGEIPLFRQMAQGGLLTRRIGQESYHFSAQPVRSFQPGSSLIHLALPVEGSPPLARPSPATVERLRPLTEHCTGSGVPEPTLAALLSVRLTSLAPVFLPPGVGFAVIDNQSKQVLFHSVARKSLHEYLLRETDSQRLRALLFAQRSEFVNIFYDGKYYRAFPRSLPSLPWSIVAFRELGLIRTANVQILTIALFCLALYTAAFLALLSVLYLIPSYRGRWIWMEPKLKMTYLQLAFVYLWCLLLYLLCLRMDDPIFLFWTGMLLPLVVILLSYFKVHFDYRRMKEEKEGRKQQGEALHWVMLGLGCLVLLILLTISLPKIDTREKLFAILVLACTAGPVLVPRRLLPSAVRTHTAYQAAATLLLVILAVPPAASFFKIACDIPLENLVKYGQVRFLRELSAMNGDAEAPRFDTPFPSRLTYAWTFFRTRAFQSTCDRESCSLGRVRQSQLHNSVLQRLEEFLPLYNRDATEMAKLTADYAEHRSWQWDHWTDGELLMHASSNAGKDTLHLSSRLPTLRFGLIDLASLILGLLAIGTVAAATIYFLTRHLLLAKIDDPLWLRHIREGSHIPLGALGGNLILVSRRDDQRALVTIPEGVVAEWIDLRAQEWPLRHGKIHDFAPGASLLIIERFEHRLDDPKLGTAKLRLLEQLLRDSTRRIVILSKLDPYFCLVANRLCTEKPADDGDRQRWMNVLSDFDTFVLDRPDGAEVEKLEQELDAKLPPPQGDSSPRPRMTWNRHVEAIRATFIQECTVSAPLLQIGRSILQDLDPEDLEPDRLIDEIEERALLYYRSIWSSLADPEKVVLVQLAEEGLVNPRSRRPLQRLLARKLVARRPNLTLMNKSFQRFVQSSACRNEVVRVEEASRRQGLWIQLRGPLTLGFWGIVAFFYATQREAFDSMVLVLTAIVGALPHVLELVGFLGSARTQAGGDS